MASSTTTRNPPNENRERIDGDHAQQGLENRPATGADRNADIVLGAALIAMGLLAGSSTSPRSPSCRL